MLQTLNFGAGGRQINAAATFFRYESGSAGGADESIRIRADGNDLGLYFPGDAIELPIQATTWDITPVNATTAGIVRLGLGRVQSARLVGNVKIIDSAYLDTQANNVFSCALAVTGTNTGQVLTQIFNPAGSGVVVSVDSISMGSNTTTNFSLCMTTTQATTSNGPSSSLLSGGAGGIAVNRYDLVGTAFSNQQFIYTGGLQAGLDRQINFKSPVVLKPGYGMFATINSQIAAFNTTFLHTQRAL
jgi:hypothetical protein